MTYRSQINVNQQVVRINHKGIVGSDEMNLGKDTAFQCLSHLGWHKILLNLRNADLQFDATDAAILFKNIRNTFPGDAYLAFVQPRQIDFDFCQFAKAIALGWPNTKIAIFPHEDLALKWLAEQ